MNRGMFVIGNARARTNRSCDLFLVFCGNLFKHVYELTNQTLTITTIGKMVEVIFDEFGRTAGIAPKKHWRNMIYGFFAHIILD